MRHYDPKLKELSRRLRKDMTDAEYVLWLHLRRKQILDIQFYRQRPIGPYIVDFLAPAVKLVVEVDGSQHLQDDGLRSDAEREQFLNGQGLTVLRFDNRQVLLEPDAVLTEILSVYGERLNPP